MKTKRKIIPGLALAVTFCASLALAQESSKSLTVVMTNDSNINSIQVYDTVTHELLQTLPTNGKGGVSGNAWGIKQFNNSLVAVVNNGSQTVSVFQRFGDKLVLKKENIISTLSAPVSVDFGNNHLYVAGTTTVESFKMDGASIVKRDGMSSLALAEGTIVPVGSTAQIGALKNQLLVTLKTDPTPGTVDVIPLMADGSIAGTTTVVPAPAQSLTPFGFSILGDGTALITLAHSGQVGLFRDGAFVSVVNSGEQGGPCWTAKVGKYIMIVNAGSKTVSREVPTGENIFIDSAVAASIVTGGAPTDSDANGGYQVVLDHTTTSHLSFFKVNPFGELTADQAPLDLGVPNANGVAILGGVVNQ